MNWTEEELTFLKENYPKNISLKDISEKLNRTIKSIHHKAVRSQIHRPRFPSNKPSNKQPAKIIDKRYYEKHKEERYYKKMERRKKLKEEMIELLGGKCSICGYKKCNGALEFHHQREKEKMISILLKGNSREKILKEAKKCILLCANCHRELHHPGP
jgi:predicted HNH restriction endonuclease